MHKELLDLILAQLAEDFPDTAKTYSPEVFADWLTGRFGKVGMLKCPSCGLADVSLHQCCHNSACVEYADERTVYEGWKTEDLSPTGRRPSQPELQHLPRPYRLPAMAMTEERAKELLQQYRDTFSDINTPGRFPNFPCVAVDLASGGVDYSVEQHPVRVEHASVDDKGNVTWSGVRRGVFSSKGPSQNLPKWDGAQDKTPRRTHADPLLAAPYGKPWIQLTPDDIYKDISGMLLREQAKEEHARRCVETGLLHEWVHLLDGRVSSYVPADQAGGAVFSTGLFEGRNMLVETMDKGEKAVTLARAYLLRLVKLEPKQTESVCPTSPDGKHLGYSTAVCVYCGFGSEDE